MPRYVILLHDHPLPHLDLMLERGGGLRTWRLETTEILAGSEMPAISLPDHRLIYLTYEGPVSGERGHVSRWDWGEYRLLREGHEWEVELSGERLRGVMRLWTREQQWQCVFEKSDEPAE